MRRFRVSNVVPPGGKYFYTTPEDGLWFSEPSMVVLMAKLSRYYTDSPYELPTNLAELVEDYMCAHLPPGFCNGGDVSPTRLITLTEIKDATTKAIQATDTRVTPGEAAARARICASCPKNNKSMCPSCVGLVAWAERKVGRRLTGTSDWMGVCEVDTVAIPAKIHLASEGCDGYPEHCWKVKETKGLDNG